MTTTADVRTFLADRLAQIEERIGAACRRAGRPRSAVTLVAVTKSVGPTAATILTELGVLDLGESRPQELWHKAEPLPPAVRWHLIGHLQRNKVERTLRRVYLVHSVDSIRLLNALESEAGIQGRPLDVLLEVNVSREENKTGFAPDDLIGLAPHLGSLQRVRPRGLMTMAAQTENPEDARPTFAELRRLRDRLQTEAGDALKLEHLSMGMTNDFEVAIEEGATLIRVGTALFDGIPGGGHA
jgi:pyridoxal phosphate enzyme (YggS family)